MAGTTAFDASMMRELLEAPELRSFADDLVAQLNLAADRAIAHLEDPHAYPLPAESDSLEHAFHTFAVATPAERQAEARKAVMARFASASERRAAYGPFADIDLHSDKSVVALEDTVMRRADFSALRRLAIEEDGVARRLPTNEGALAASNAAATVTTTELDLEIDERFRQIESKYHSLGGSGGVLGAQTGHGVAPDGAGAYVHYENGSIYYSPETGAHEVRGAIRDKYAALGWERSALGYPISDEIAVGGPEGQPLAAAPGRASHFQYGAIYWQKDIGAHEVHGAIRAKYDELGGLDGSLIGYPLSDEAIAPDEVGRYNHFANGSIYWKPSTGAHWICKAHFEEWSKHRWEQGFLGYPIASTEQVDGVFVTKMEGGWLRGGQLVAGDVEASGVPTKLRVRLHEVACIVETGMPPPPPFDPKDKPGGDELRLTGVATAANLASVASRVVDLGDEWDSGNALPARDITSNDVLHEWDLTALTGYPRSYLFTSMLVEKDGGGMGPAVQKLLDKIEEITKEELEKKATEYGMTIGAGIGTAVGGPLGALIGAVVGALLGYLVAQVFDWLRKQFKDQVFAAQPASVVLLSAHSFPDGRLRTSNIWHHVEIDELTGGEYKYSVYFDLV